MANKLKITLKRSLIGQTPKNKATAKALGLNKIGKSVEMQDNGSVRGMVRKIRHMVNVEEI